MADEHGCEVVDRDTVCRDAERAWDDESFIDEIGRIDDWEEYQKFQNS